MKTLNRMALCFALLLAAPAAHAGGQFERGFENELGRITAHVVTAGAYAVASHAVYGHVSHGHHVTAGITWNYHPVPVVHQSTYVVVGHRSPHRHHRHCGHPGFRGRGHSGRGHGGGHAQGGGHARHTSHQRHWRH